MKRSLLFLVVCGLLATHTIAWAADFPSKPIQIFVHTKPGGAVDLMARQLAQVAANYCDQPLVVINKPGGSGLLALADVYKSKPDGYTLLAFLFFFMSLYFPAPRKGTFVGAATVPQFWTLFLAAMAVTILVRTLRAAPEEDKPPDGPGWWSRLSCW